MHKDNVYLRYNRYTGSALQPTQSTFSAEITGYAAHYWAWRYVTAGSPNFLHKTLCKGAADALVRMWHGSPYWLPFEPGSVEQYFFDCGIAARGLMAASRACQTPLYADVATQITAAMQGMEVKHRAGEFVPIIEWDSPEGRTYPGFGNVRYLPGDYETVWWSKGPFAHQRKAALAFRLVGEKGSFDRLDLSTSRLGFGDFKPAVPTLESYPAEMFAADKKAAKKSKLTIVQHGDGYALAPWFVELQRADYNHPFAYIVEASAMCEQQQARALVELQALEDRIKGTPMVRSDSYAQMLRAKMYLQNGALPTEVFDRLIAMQHTSGGFRFSEANEDYRPTDVSVHATIFACQALQMMVLYDERKITDPAQPFGRRELAIV